MEATKTTVLGARRLVRGIERVKLDVTQHTHCYSSSLNIFGGGIVSLLSSF
jgi:hypothetical protein